MVMKMENKQKYKCIKMNFDGSGVIKYKNEDFNIKNLLLNEEATINVENKGKKTFLSVDKILTKSNDRINPVCPHFLECGGCQYLHMSYESESLLKENYLKELFSKFTDISLLPFISMKDEYFYRNKCQMTYKLSKSKKVVCGFYEENSHHIVPVSDCKIQSKEATQVINAFNEALTKNKIAPYDEKTNTGVIKHVVVRYGFTSKELMLVIVTNGEIFPGRNNVVKDLLKKQLPITTIVQNYNPRETSIVLGDKERVLYGPGFIFDEINGIKFKISSRSFYQINPVGTSKLYQKAIELAKIKSTDIVLDTYCGIGTIGMFAAKHAKQVIGVELNKDAYIDAISNAKSNKIGNITFVNKDSTKYMVELANNKEKIDILILDPPRDGSTKEFINAVKMLAPRQVVYVSCEPKTLIRDLYLFSNIGYSVKQVQGFDMFPRTFNIETVVCLTLNTK